MAGYIIYNGFWNPGGPSDPVCRLQAAAAGRGCILTPLPNTELIARFESGVAVEGLNGEDYALFWDKDVRLARAMEACGMRLYNSAAGVALCDDKAATHLCLAAAGLPMPRTLAAPMTYLQMDAGPSAHFLEEAEQRLGFPMVVKECFGSLGGQVYLARNREELARLSQDMAARPFLAQEFIGASAGRDVRLYMVGGQLAAAMERRSDVDFRANVGAGGRAAPYAPPQEEIRLAAACCRLLGVGFAGVDLLHDKDGRPLVCEVNSNAYMAALTDCTGVDVAGCIVDYVLEREAAHENG